ncbi:MAG: N-acetylmuramoyl-L-alanine amidase [Clostridiales bacterium]|nr:N-acetylmuramoyl-L-alanine amidase [Clostridiales bacterium]
MARDRQKNEGEPQKRSRRRRSDTRLYVVLGIDLALVVAILFVCALMISRSLHERRRPDLSALVAPDWYTQDFLEINPYSRPGTKRSEINDIVIHYVANPGTSARQNWNYFNNLANQTGEGAVSASSHYIIGIDGEILQGIPLDEIAYANAPRNDDTVSIECCHPDESGEFTEETMESLVRLTAWLCEELDLDEHSVIRHYDVNGKDCPKYYVAHEDAWRELLAAVKKKRKES